MNIKKEIEKLLEKSLLELKIAFDGDFNLDHPQDLKNGDWTTNIAMQLAGKEGKNPREIAQQFHDTLSENLSENIEKVEIAGAGYLNFYLSKTFYKNSLKEISQKREKWGSNKNLEGKKYLNEKISPNLFKPLHIGHVVTATFSESLPRIFSFSNAETTNISYPSNVSLGLAKAVWSLIDENKIKDFSIDDIGKAYARGTQKYDKSDAVKEKVREINKNIYNKKKSIEFEVYKIGIEKNLEYFIQVSKRLGSTFDGFIFESESAEEGLPIVKENISKIKGEGIFEISNGAVIFDGERRGLHTRVFVNSEGLPTYETKDIGLISLKSKRYDFDKAIVCVDGEQEQYFKVVKMAMSEIRSEWSDKVEFLKHGRLNFVGEKISSRYGNVPLAEDLIDKVKENIFEIVKEKDFSEEEKDKMAEKIAIGALKYSFLKVTMGKNMIFDFTKSLDFSGNSGPYLQYSYVRAKSILAKIEKTPRQDLGVKNGEVSDLEKILYRFPEKVIDSLETYSPHHIANYLYDLASEFNSFYAHTKILDSDNSDYNYNLVLVENFAQTMKNGLYLLGIETVEKM